MRLVDADYIKESVKRQCDNCRKEGMKWMADSVERAIIEELDNTPSAQPQRPEQPESAKEYCAECDHIEMCRWYPYEGCEFRSLPSVQPERRTDD